MAQFIKIEDQKHNEQVRDCIHWMSCCWKRVDTFRFTRLVFVQGENEIEFNKMKQNEFV